MDTTSIIKIVLVIVAVWFLYKRLAPTKGLRTRTLSYKDFGQELQNQKNPILIDVREAGEFNTGYIPGAINIPLSRLKNKVSEIPKDKNVYMYCRSGMRSE
ncbi:MULTISPECIES: rhodanese-like domain-containing protein [Paenibacillus]|uniref:rhodanese-like domain-containing protein n=1 Tax=Paenibacillus TaxID=44249 RepID=UPI0029E7EA5E|nr:rhodanese-like domain-containing protein [Paenibacillus caseinilyticus]